MSVRAAGAPAAGVQPPEPQCRVSIGAPVQANRRLDEVLAIGFAKLQIKPCADTEGKRKSRSELKLEDELGMNDDKNPNPDELMSTELMSILEPSGDDRSSELQDLMDSFPYPDSNVEVNGFEDFEDLEDLEYLEDLEDLEEPGPAFGVPGPSTSKRKGVSKIQFSKRQTEILENRYAQYTGPLRHGEAGPLLEQLNALELNEMSVNVKQLIQWIYNRNRPERQERAKEKADRKARHDQLGLIEYNEALVTVDQRKKLRALQKQVWYRRNLLERTTLHNIEGAKAVLEQQYKIYKKPDAAQMNIVIRALQEAIKDTTFREEDVQDWFDSRTKFEEKIENLNQYIYVNNIKGLKGLYMDG